MQSPYTSRKVAVFGLGASGRAAARLLLRHGAEVTLLDGGSGAALEQAAEELRGEGMNVVLGPEAERHQGGYDYGVVSPGIDVAVPLVRNFIAAHPDAIVIGEIELAFSLCACPVVAITGTNGKTTTTQLVEQMLNACGVRTRAAGNIGPAFSERVHESSGLDLFTLEVSSFQLETIREFRPDVAVWLNFEADHLDRYPSMEAYREAKLRIFENQRESDFAVVKLGSPLPELKARVITFSAYERGGDLDLRDGVIHFHGQPVLRLSDTHLRGLHNAENLMAALGVGAARGLPFEPMVRALCDYRALPHRCELVRTLEGVDYVNDSKATNLDALEKALLSEERPVILIAGGKDKGFEFDSLVKLVGERVQSAVLIGEMAQRIAESWADVTECVPAATLAEAVEVARSKAASGSVVLFSPGTSSFDMFRSYADRGDRFRDLVQNL